MKLELDSFADPAPFPFEIQTLVTFSHSFAGYSPAHDPLLRARDNTVRINSSLCVVYREHSNIAICGFVSPSSVG